MKEKSKDLFCIRCSTVLLAGAAYCHACGQKQETEQRTCPSCAYVFPNVSQPSFCPKCGFQLEKQGLKASWLEAFETYLEQALGWEGLESLIALAKTAFRHASAQAWFENQILSLGQEEPHLDLLAQCYDAFLVEFGSDWLPAPLASGLLQYAQTFDFQGLHLRNMMLDYLNLGQENEIYYLNSIELPPPSFERLRQSFFHAPPHSPPLLIIERSSLFGGQGSYGLVLSPDTLYWRQNFHAPQQLAYQALNTWSWNRTQGLYLNNAYLDINPGFNFKLLKLLLKLRQLSKP